MSEVTKTAGRPRKYETGLATDWENQTEYNRSYYLKNKEKAKQKYLDTKTKIECECGAVICNQKFKLHLETKLHQRRLEKKNKTLNII